MARNKRPRAQSHPPMIQAPAARTGSKESRPRSKFSRDKIRGQVRLVDVFCYHCGERFDDIRTDDIAPYFTILIVGHLIAPFILLLERLYAPPLWVHWLAWPVLTVLLTLLVLPRIKGGVLGWMWWLGLRGDEQH